MWTNNPTFLLSGQLTGESKIKHSFIKDHKYQPSGEGGTRSPTATPHCLQNPKWLEQFITLGFWALRPTFAKKFFDPSTPSMRKGRDTRRKKQGKKTAWTPFQTPLAILGPPGGHFGFCRRCRVAGDAAFQSVSECPLRR